MLFVRFSPFLLFLSIIVTCKYLPLAGQKPHGRYPVLLHEICEPRGLEYVPRHVLLKRVHVPAVYPELAGECLLAPDNLHVFQIVQCFEKPLYHFLAVLRLHGSSDFLFASANFAFISLSRAFSRSCHFDSVSGLKTGFLPVAKASSS